MPPMQEDEILQDNINDLEETYQDSSEYGPPEGIDHIYSSQTQKGFEIRPSGLRFPQSRYLGYIPPLPQVSERRACVALQKAFDEQPLAAEAECVEFGLTDFSIYMPPGPLYGNELRGLQFLASRNAHSCFLFDGVLTCGEKHHYVEGVPFKICSIGNYGEEQHGVGDAIWVQSDFNKNSDTYYRLQKPSKTYARFHEGFLWLADLAKHFVDYSLACQADHQGVSTDNFRSEFYLWCQERHEGAAEFESWYLEYGNNDFRQAVSSNVNFLYKEALGVTHELQTLHIWKELLEKCSVKQHPIKEQKTVVTQYVYDCFSHLKFGHHLKVIRPSVVADNGCNEDDMVFTSGLSARNLQTDTKSPAETGPLDRSIHNFGLIREQRRPMIKAIKPGDVLAVTKDGPGGIWKDEVSRWKQQDDCWFILVQAKHESAQGDISFSGIWLYRPSDTPCAKMKYPFPKELFLSDNCTCRSSKIEEDEVLGVTNVQWYGQPSQSNHFVRQTYLDNEKFVSLKDSHKVCEHLGSLTAEKTPIHDQFPIGQTVLVLPSNKHHLLEPYEVLGYNWERERLKTFVVLRKLIRRSELDPKGNYRPNELVYTDQTQTVLASRIERACLVRLYKESDEIPAPYNRNGTASTFFITKRLQGGELTPIESEYPESLLQGFDPRAPPPQKQLAGLDLFCGGGNLGRGLEEGGAVHNHWAVDLAPVAVETYAANTSGLAKTQMFCGSVNDLLAQAFAGNPQGLDIPRPGDVDVLQAGSPCQGFSLMNHHRTGEHHDQGLQHQSLVASVAAYIDFYRPKYGLLENVLNMAQKGLGRDEDVLSQLVCSIVGLGYQCQLFILDAWSFGSPQSRSRIFVSFAAPHCVPLSQPEPSHSHPDGVKERGLGKLANGESFGRRIHCATPFKFRTAGEATADLPYIGDGATQHCTKYPDHIQPPGISSLHRVQAACIPNWPRGLNFAKTWKQGKGEMTSAERNLFPHKTKSGKPKQSVLPSSKAWGRIKPQGLFPTQVVHVCIEDARMGTILHWDQPRRLTLLEQRRAQSFPDEEVIVGTAMEQSKIIGNSVDRSVSLALGIALRHAWLQKEEENPKDARLTERPTATTSFAIDLTHNTLEPVQESSSFSNLPLRAEETSSNLLVLTKKSQKRRRSVLNDEPIRKSPRVTPAPNLATSVMRLFAKATSQTIPNEDTSTPTPAKQTVEVIIPAKQPVKISIPTQQPVEVIVHTKKSQLEPSPQSRGRSLNHASGNTVAKATTSSAAKYVPVDNSHFDAYAQTHGTMASVNDGEARKPNGFLQRLRYGA